MLFRSETRPEAFLAGDRNLTNGHPPINGILLLQTNQALSWAKGIHKQEGNLLIGDGSVQRVSNKMLKMYLAKTGLTTNRLLLP